MLLSEHIQNEVLTITSEHPYSEDHFEAKFQAKISLISNCMGSQWHIPMSHWWGYLMGYKIQGHWGRGIEGNFV